MDDKQFYFECWFNCYVNQIDGYAFGAKQRLLFKPIVPFVKDENGRYNRVRTLDAPCYTFTDEQRAKLLEVPNAT